MVAIQFPLLLSFTLFLHLFLLYTIALNNLLLSLLVLTNLRDILFISGSCLSNVKLI